MLTFIAALHIIVSFILVLFILLQNPKGSSMGILGGQSSSKSVFSSTGASDFLVKITKWSAVIFALTSIQLAYMNTKKGSSVILDQNTPSTEAVPAPADPPSETNTAPEEKAKGKSQNK